MAKGKQHGGLPAPLKQLYLVRLNVADLAGIASEASVNWHAVVVEQV